MSNISPLARRSKLSDEEVARAALSLRKANKAIEDAYRADEDFDIFLKEVKFLKVNENYNEESINIDDM